MKYSSATALLLLFLTSCGQEYVIKDNQVYLKGWNEADGSHELLIEAADAKTFQAIDSKDNILIGKDKSHVYYEGKIIANCDPKTVKYLGNYYYSDQDSVYFFGFYNNINNCEVVGANPKTIRILDQYPWAIDDKHVIYGQTISKTSDISSFIPLSEKWAKTDTNVFYEGEPLDSIDTKTFKVMDDENGKDKNRVYHKGY